MRAALLTKEYPPEVYGGAGVHVEYLAAALARRGDVDVAVHAMGAPRDEPLVAGTYGHWDALDGDRPELGALRTFSTDLAMVAGVGDADLVHSHTWYANLAGHLAKLTYDVPHVVTTHSLEPLRPWKREQLGGGYALSSWAERTALTHADRIVAVSQGMRDDILAAYRAVDPDRVVVVHNGIDLDEYQPVDDTSALVRNGVDPDRPYALFVGRITRQKGVTHLLDACRHLPADAQVVLAAGAPDTPAIAEEFRAKVATLADAPPDVVWIEEMLPKADVVQLLSHTRVFVCPSIYEPFGIVNVEAMACGAPVVASAVGGIPEVVVDGETGHLVEFTPSDDAYGTPADPEGYARDLADAIARLLFDADAARAMGAAGRRRAEEHFSWDAIAERTAEVYRDALTR
jgi:starch synthase